MHVVSTAESQRAIRAAEVAAANEAEPQTAIKGKRAARAVSWTAPRDVTKPTPLRTHLGAIRQFGRVVARSAAMHEVFEVLERFAQTDVTVTLCGETGVGKDILAHALHE
ncbi:MAG TPA: sigma 54-interacting transcriptional regulator, partial [Polyangiaceae bacterium]|nr:sigma 54-interacting transcriptional regulator [Polyangiaceae bacterium]